MMNEEHKEAVNFAQDVAQLDSWVTPRRTCPHCREARETARLNFIYDVLIQLVLRADCLTTDEQADLCNHILASRAAGREAVTA